MEDLWLVVKGGVIDTAGEEGGEADDKGQGGDMQGSVE